MVGTAETPIAVGTARPVPVGAGAVVIVVISGGALCSSSRCTPDTVRVTARLRWGARERVVFAVG